MKQKILDALKARFEGVPSAILGRMADALVKTVAKEEDVDSAVEGVTFQQLFEAELDRRANDATQTAISNYEKKHGLKDGQPASGGGQGTRTEPNNNQQNPPEGGAQGAQGVDLAAQIAAAIKAAVEPLTAKITTLEAGKTADTRKQRLDTAIATGSDKFKTRISRDYARMNFKDDEDYNAWITEVETEAKEEAEASATQGAAFGRPFTGGKPPKDEVPKQIQAYLEGAAAKDGQPF